MPQAFTAPVLTAVHSRAAVMEELRRLLPGAADPCKTLPFGLAALDSCLPAGGLPCGGLHEIVPGPYGIPAALGFIAAILGRLTYSLGGREKAVLVLPAYGLGLYGRLHGHGLRALGLDPSRLILIETARRKDTLWAIEEALRSDAPAAIAGIVDQLDLKTSQRLQLIAADAGLPLFLLRPAQNLESSAASTRWRVGTAEAARDRFGLITRPRWHLQLERARNGRPGEWVVEYDHVAHRFSLAAALADPAHVRGAGEEAGRKSRCA
jgi:protein ImuA